MARKEEPTTRTRVKLVAVLVVAGLVVLLLLDVGFPEAWLEVVSIFMASLQLLVLALNKRFQTKVAHYWALEEFEFLTKVGGFQLRPRCVQVDFGHFRRRRRYKPYDLCIVSYPGSRVSSPLIDDPMDIDSDSSEATIDMQPVAADGIDVQPVAADGIDLQPVAADGIDVQPVAADGIDVQLVAADGIDVQPVAADRIVLDRQKMKETQEFKEAEAHEWKQRKIELERQASEIRRQRKKNSEQSDVESRQKHRLQEIRRREEQAEFKLKLKDDLRAEVRVRLEGLTKHCTDMASLLEALGTTKEGEKLYTDEQVISAYKRALLKLHPDHLATPSNADPRTKAEAEVEQEEKFKLMQNKQTILPNVVSR